MKMKLAYLLFLIAIPAWSQTTNYSDANGMPVGTAQSPQTIQLLKFQQAPTFPTSPLFPSSPRGM